MTTLPRRRSKPRRTRTPRCQMRGCKRAAVAAFNDVPSELYEIAGALGLVSGPQVGDKVVNTGHIELCRSHGNEERWKRLSLEVRSIGRCELAGRDNVRCGGGLQAAHIFPKGAYPAIKFDRENLLCLCAGHHRFYTERWMGWMKVVIALVGQERFDAIWARSGA